MRFITAILLSAALSISVGYADEAHHALSEGEVRRVDRDAQKITIRHGPLANLDMPPMTMVFQVKDPALLERAKAGDKVKFRAEKEGGVYILTALEALN